MISEFDLNFSELFMIHFKIDIGVNKLNIILKKYSLQHFIVMAWKMLQKTSLLRSIFTHIFTLQYLTIKYASSKLNSINFQCWCLCVNIKPHYKFIWLNFIYKNLGIFIYFSNLKLPKCHQNEQIKLQMSK